MPFAPPPWSSLGVAYGAHRHGLARALQNSFASTSHDLIEDAINDAFLVVLQDGLSSPGEQDTASNALLYRIAWRCLRGQLRRKAARVECGAELVPDVADLDTPESAALAGGLAQVVDLAISGAALRYSKRHPDTLEAALRDRVWNGESDGVVATRHGVRREMLNRARNDVLEQVRAAA